VIDAIGMQIAWSRLIGLCDEASAMLQKTSFSPIVRESHDYTCLLLDAAGDVVAQEDLALTLFVYSAQQALKAILAEHPVEEWQPGEMYGTNDPWLGSADLHDVHLFGPVFRQGDLIAFSGSVAHWPDIGGRQWSSTAREIFEEGLRIPPMRLMSDGVVDPAFAAILRANVRVPRQVFGDFSAQIVAAETMASGLRRLLDDGIIPDFPSFAEQIKDLSEQSLRRAINDFPDGVFRYDIDLDGLDSPMRLSAVVTIAGSEMEVNFDESSPQVPGGVNSVRNYSVAHSMFAVKAMLDPTTPNNAGAFRPVRFVTREGSIVDARSPAPTGGRKATGHFTAMCVFGALSQAPGVRSIAEYGNLWHVMLTCGTAAEPWVTNVLLSSGIGARSNADGWSCRMFPSNAAGTSIEIIEQVSPLLVWKKMYRPGSGGAGRFRGGLGQEIEVELLGEDQATVTLMGDKVVFPPRGVAGGDAGSAGDVTVDGNPTPAKALFQLEPRGRLIVRTPGGGGNGPPEGRDPQLRALDTRLGLVVEQDLR
jgi:N-methylhydantoinase B